MTDVVKVALIAATPGMVAAILGWWNGRRIRDVKLHINSRFDEFVTEARRIARAEGVIEGKLSKLIDPVILDQIKSD